jgi:hypothetical protein
MKIKLTHRGWLFMVLLVLALTACGPEDGRARGGGPGGDANNKPAVVVPKSKVFSNEAEGRNP